MNTAQARRLARLLEDAQPPLALFHEEGDALDVTLATVGYEDSDVTVRLFSVTGLLGYPGTLYIDEAGSLWFWDVEKPDDEAKTPCLVSWRYGAGERRYADHPHYRYLDAKPRLAEVAG